tara:strand:- start:157 stop:6048 length:5892 start_codon:yes stop_codon:yes gene_type:complete
MPKYLSGRVKRTPQSALTDDRYQYLGLEQSEPNLGDSPSLTGSPNIPAGNQFQIISIDGYPGERFWIPIGGGIIPGSISVFDEGFLVGTGNSITQLDFRGLGIGVSALPLGVAATITVAPPGDNGSVLFKESDDFATSSNLVFDTNVGILTVGNGLDIGIGGTIITATAASGIASVGIGTSIATHTLHVNGDFRLTEHLYDYTNDKGVLGDIIIRGANGIEWTSPNVVTSGAGGTIYNIQYHNTAGLVDGADNFVWNSTTNRIGIGSTQPSTLLDVLGVSTFNGGVTVDNLYISGVTTAKNVINADGGLIANSAKISDLTNGRVVFVGLNGELEDNTNFTFDKVTETLSIPRAVVSGISTFDEEVILNSDLKVVGVATVGSIKLDANKISTPGTLLLDSLTKVTDETEATSKIYGAFIVAGGVGIGSQLYVGGDTHLATDAGITTTGGDLYVGGNLYVKNELSFDNGNFVNLDVTGIATIATLGVTGVTTTKNLIVTGISTFESDIYLGNNDKIKFGDTLDFHIYNNGSNAIIDNQSSGDLVLQSSNDILLKTSGNKNAIVATKDAQVTLHHNGVEKLTTVGLGISVIGDLEVSNNLQVDGNSFLNGNITLGNQVTDEISFTGKVDTTIIPKNNGTQDLGGTSNRWDTVYAKTFNGLTKVNTSEITVERLVVTGIATFKDDVEFWGNTGVAKSAYWDKSEHSFKFVDDTKTIFGDNDRLQIYANSNGSYLKTIVGGFHQGITDSWGVYNSDLSTHRIEAKDTSVDLYHSGVKKLETTLEGVLVSGTTSTTDLKVSGFVTSHLLPGDASGTYDLGSIDNKWGTVYANRVEGLTNVDVDDLYVTGIATFKDDVEFHGSDGLNKLYWDKTDDSLIFKDSIKSKYGTSADASIYHDNSDFIIDNTQGSTYISNTGNVYLRTSDTKNAVKCIQDLGVEIYHNAQKKIETTQAGILVGGGVTSYQGGLTLGSSSSYDVAAAGDIVTDGGTDGIAGFYNSTDDGLLKFVCKNSGGVNSTLLSIQVSTGITAGANLLPGDTGTYDLGSAGKIWNKIYANEFVGQIIGNVGSATTAENVIGGIADVTQLNVSPGISTLSNLKVTGVSTFSALVDINAGGQADTFKVEDLTDNEIVIAGTGGELEGSSNLTFDGSTLTVTGITTTTNLSVSNYVDSNLIPDEHQLYDLGTEDKKWSTVWAKRVEGLTNVDVDELYVTGIATFKNDVEFWGNAGTGKSAYWDKSDTSLNFNDGIVAKFGAGLQVYNDGSDSIINDSSSGKIFLTLNRASGSPNNEEVHIQGTDGFSAKFFPSLQTELYFAGNKKFSTDIAGAIITGVTTTNDLSVINHVNSNLIPDGTFDLGSTLKVWDEIHCNTLYANNQVQVNDYIVDQLLVTGIATFKNNVYLLDNDILNIGGNEYDALGRIQIVHDGANAYFKNTVGVLTVFASNSQEFNIQEDVTGEYFAKYLTDDTTNTAVHLYNNNNVKLKTVSGGVYINDSIGIGSESPVYSVDVVGSSSTIARIVSTGTSVHLQFSNSETDDYNQFQNSTDGYIGYANTDLTFHTFGIERLSITGEGHVIPKVTSAVDLGSQTKRFNTIYANNIDGYISATVAFAQTATDVIGGIASVTQLQVSPGISTFNGDVYFNGAGGNALLDNLEWNKNNKSLTFYNNAYLIIGTTGGNNWATKIYSDSAGGAAWSAAEGGGSIAIVGKDATTSHFITLKPNNAKESIKATANSSVDLYHDGNLRIETTQEGVLVSGITSTTDLKVSGFVTSHLLPGDASGTYDLGSTGNKWGTVYANTFDGVFQGTSDKADAVKVEVVNNDATYYVGLVTDISQLTSYQQINADNDSLTFNPNTNLLTNEKLKVEQIQQWSDSGTGSATQVITANGSGGWSWQNQQGSGGGSGIEGVEYDPYCSGWSPKPITVGAGNTNIIISDESNAYGRKYVQSDDPTSSAGGNHTACDGDIWYDTST